MLLEMGFSCSFSLSDVLREEATTRGMGHDRDSLVALGNELRAREGPGVLGRLALGKVMPRWSEHQVIDSIRHPAEVAALRQRPFFMLLAVDSPLLIRYERVRSRGRDGELSLADFVAADDREGYGLLGTHGQDLRGCMALADARIVNAGSLEDLRATLLRLEFTDERRWTRPSWDEYFSRLARLASRRSNCMKRGVGAVIVLDNRLVATGYNGTPRGTTNCNSGGCRRCNDGVATQGVALHECLCVHAEANAIVEAGVHRARGGTMYCTLKPCLGCAKLIVQTGVVRVVYEEDYVDASGGEVDRLWSEVGIAQEKKKIW